MTFVATVSIGDLLTLITIILVAITGFIQIRQIYRQSRLTSFSDYTKRYQEILLNLPSNYFSDLFGSEIITMEEQERIRRYIRIYFDLCSEEFFLHEQRYLPRRVWQEWEQGIISNFRLSHVALEWKRSSESTDLYNDFKKYIEAVISER